MSPRALTSAAFAIVTTWGLILGLALDSGPLLILAFFALLLWFWWGEHTSPRWGRDR